MIENAFANRATMSYRIIAFSCVIHALAVLAFWTALFVVNLDLIPGNVWLALAWLWLIWPIVLALHPGRTLKRIAWPVLVAIGLLVPCVPVVFTFTLWAVQGFA